MSGSFRSPTSADGRATLVFTEYVDTIRGAKQAPGRNGLYSFVSYGREMFDTARRYLPKMSFDLCRGESQLLDSLCLGSEKLFIILCGRFENVY